jgi:hypothetical protein
VGVPERGLTRLVQQRLRRQHQTPTDAAHGRASGRIARWQATGCGLGIHSTVRTVGRPVRYTGGDKDAWHAAFARNLSGHKRTDWEASFKMLGRLQVRASKAELETTGTLLGREPRRYAEYVHDMATAWLPQTERTTQS